MLRTNDGNSQLLYIFNSWQELTKHATTTTCRVTYSRQLSHLSLESDLKTELPTFAQGQDLKYYSMLWYHTSKMRQEKDAHKDGTHVVFSNFLEQEDTDQKSSTT